MTVSSRLRHPSAVALVALFLGSLAAGCAQESTHEDDGEETSSDAIVAPVVIVANPAATRAAVVQTGSVRLPAAVAEPYRKLAVGSIFIGARSEVKGHNPDGFLRRVVSVEENGGEVVVITQPAALTDAFVTGGFHPSSNGGQELDDHGAGTQSITALTRNALDGIEIEFGNRPLYEGVDEITIGNKKARFVESIQFENAVISAKPVVDIDVRIRDGKVSRFIAKVEGQVRTSVRANVDVAATGDVDAAILSELHSRKHDVERVIYRSARVPLPTRTLAGVPFSPSVEFTVTLKCQLAFGGALMARAGVETDSYVRMGVVYDGSKWGRPIQSEFNVKPSFTMARGGEVDARCAIQIGAELSAYGGSGVAMSIAPYLNFGVKSDGAPAPTYHYRVDGGADGAMHGRSNVFGVRAEDLERKLVEWKSTELLEGSGR